MVLHGEPESPHQCCRELAARVRDEAALADLQHLSGAVWRTGRRVKHGSRGVKRRGGGEKRRNRGVKRRSRGEKRRSRGVKHRSRGV